ncbi:dipeptide/oligopeptide/nickel ABC transporter permease/ATP-binding protein [Microbacterium suaedae]|uniref:dipeptide/oligopeptide/nickel ABC transporter permease/ATP-binding protein n=1 Tax=Microbacterium suaedae TaxID=2067813 RepID=UPI000DA1ECD9|nr:dipeptide/oligopeptide/nickel ABC transporter permease/ATP-binding protein [Microbacterium suaedae]
MTTTDVRMFRERDERARRSRLLRRFLRHPGGFIPASVFLFVVLVAVFAPWLSPHDPNFVDLAATKAPPSPEHLLGGDSTGRDILSRLIFGARTTLWGALVTIATAVVLGVPAGVVAGYRGGVFDRVASWVSDALQSVPGMIILLVVAAGTGSNFVILMATVGVFMVPGYFRISRSTALSVAGEPFVAAAVVAGLSDTRIVFRHIVATVYPPVIIQTALTAGMSMGIQAGLQFLGIGDANTPSWGAMMNEGFRLMLSEPLILLWPSLALGVTIAVLAVMGSTLAELVRVKAPVAGGVDRPDDEAHAASGELAHADGAQAVAVHGLRVSYATAAGETEVVHGVSLDVAPGEVVGIVGESGSGKSQTVFSLLDLLPEGGTARADRMVIGGRDVLSMPTKRRQELLGREIGYIPQEPMSNLDPCSSVGHQLVEPLRRVHGLGRAEAIGRALHMLARVGIPDPERVMHSYPHEISGGMAQRVLIAGALAGDPSVLVADEPTTALDVTVQAEVLELLRELQREAGSALLIVTHDFGVVADICDRVVVMRGGSVVETGPVAELFSRPSEAYTRDLIAASLDDAASRAELDRAWRESGREVAR